MCQPKTDGGFKSNYYIVEARCTVPIAKGENAMSKITNIEELKEISKNIRRNIVEQIYSAQSGHPGGSLSIADLLTILYFNQMEINPENPKDEGAW